MVDFVIKAFGLACAMFAIVIGGAWLYDYLDWRIWEDDEK